jgi:hypothetical protein
MQGATFRVRKLKEPAVMVDFDPDHPDMRLIEAAPDLLEAMEKYVEHFGDPLKCARAAIAKATGQEVESE